MQLILFLLLLISPVYSNSATITDVTGTVTHDSSITISGSGFGSGSWLGSVIWDNVEDGSVEDAQATIGQWRNTITMGTVTGQNRHNHGSYVARYNFDTSAGSALVQTPLDTPGSRYLYFQYWFRCDENLDMGNMIDSTTPILGNVKIWRIWSQGGTGDIYGGTWWTLTGNGQWNTENLGGTYSQYDVPLTKNMLNDKSWHLMQVEFRDSSASNVADAQLRIWYDGKLIETHTGFVGTVDGTYKRVAQIGWYSSTLGPPDTSPNYWYMDEMYTAPTLARVEIGNAANYNDCTHREIQIPTAWSDTEATITFNQGSFADSGQVYIFLVDEAGSVSAGYPITIGSGTNAKVRIINGYSRLSSGAGRVLQ